MSDEFLPKPFRCDVVHDDGTARVRPSGELDMSTVRVLEQQTAPRRTPPARGGSWSTCAGSSSWTRPG